ncbi:hypothetical protein ACFVMC_09920 [Nocardia sp. NPDC127579]|uniref:hypothetical protein n=1 Tax=Nocardia sp. NPDC127579 TaxID=3345402 RepID=UPI0036298C3B
MRSLRVILMVIAVSQLVLGVLFLAAPTLVRNIFQFETAEPGWTDWLMVMMGGRFLGFAYGMYLAARDPSRHVAWINAMIVVQAVDWIATVIHLATGDVRLTQVPTTVVMPVVAVVVLMWLHPGRTTADTFARDR